MKPKINEGKNTKVGRPLLYKIIGCQPHNYIQTSSKCDSIIKKFSWEYATKRVKMGTNSLEDPILCIDRLQLQSHKLPA